MKRREFVTLSAAAATLPLFPRRQAPRFEPFVAAATPFDLSRVRLLPGVLKDATDINRRFLMAQEPDRLLHNFRINAGQASTAEPLGGWEAPVNELRGHYVGHYLSACALMTAQGDAELKARGDALVAALAACQQANEIGRAHV